MYLNVVHIIFFIIALSFEVKDKQWKLLVETKNNKKSKVSDGTESRVLRWLSRINIRVHFSFID